MPAATKPDQETENRILRELLRIAIEIDNLYARWYAVDGESEETEEEMVLWRAHFLARKKFRAALAEYEPMLLSHETSHQRAIIRP